VAALAAVRPGGQAGILEPGQLGLGMPAGGPDFASSPPSPLLASRLAVAPGAESAARSSALEGASSLQVWADLQGGGLSVEAADLQGSGARSQSDSVLVAWARYNNSIQHTGWAHLGVGFTDDSRVSKELKMYAAGFLEGLASAQQIRDFQHNAGILMQHDESKHHALENIRDMFGRSLALICNKSGMVVGKDLLDSTAPADAWWRQARYALLQAWGTLDAYNREVSHVRGRPMSMVDLMILNSDGETPELEVAFDMEEYLLRQSQRDGEAEPSDESSLPQQAFLQRRTARRLHQKPRGAAATMAGLRRKEELRRLDDSSWRRIKRASGRCSALVRLTEGGQDLMVGHTTFSDYSEMSRIFKYYDMPLGGNVRRMGFSSYPGVAGSTDDYYLLDSGLVITETTISMLTDEPYDKLDDHTGVPDFMRIMISNRLAREGKDWVELMQKSATGTYSSQWMVVDYNRFEPGMPLSEGTFFVLEQVPGKSHAQDMSNRLQEKGFWSSENRAWYKDVRDSAGATEATELHGDLFSADRNPRAKIFQATAPQVQSLADIRNEMRLNRWPHETDGGEANTPDHAIAARGDLDTSSPNPNGAVDSKVTNRCLAALLRCDAISGPTAQSQKPFRWTDAASGAELYPGTPHDGLPDAWNFDWVRMTPDGESPLYEKGAECGSS